VFCRKESAMCCAQQSLLFCAFVTLIVLLRPSSSRRTASMWYSKHSSVARKLPLHTKVEHTLSSPRFLDVS
jgi:hypothetical protein